MIDPRDRMDPDQLDALSRVFEEQLVACLEDCAQGRRGLFQEAVGEENAWPEAARLRELALVLEGVYSAHEERCALCEEFLELCSISGSSISGGSISGGSMHKSSMHGESNAGERRLARVFLARIERGEVGTPTESGKKPW
jgi:hypothetical protein